MSELIELKKRRGKALHAKNPFISVAVAETKQGVRRISSTNGDKMLVIGADTGVVHGSAAFMQYEAVDQTKFVKLYSNGMKGLKQLTNAGTKVVEVLFHEVSKKIGQDKIYLSFSTLDANQTPMSEATFNRGMKELLEKSFIAATPTIGWYWLNLTFMWNGDRLAFVKMYHLKPTIEPKEKKQIDKKDDNKIDAQTMDMFEKIISSDES